MGCKYIIIFFLSVFAVQGTFAFPKNTYDIALSQINNLETLAQNTLISTNSSITKILDDATEKRRQIASVGYGELRQITDIYEKELHLINDQLLVIGNVDAMKCISYALIWQPQTGAARSIEAEMSLTQNTLNGHIDLARNHINQAYADVGNMDYLLDLCAESEDQAACYMHVVDGANLLVNNSLYVMQNAVVVAGAHVNTVVDGNKFNVDKTVATGVASITRGYQEIKDCIASNIS